MCYCCNAEPVNKFFNFIIFFFFFIAFYLLRKKKPKNQASIRQDRQWIHSEHNMLVINACSRQNQLLWPGGEIHFSKIMLGERKEKND